VAMGLEKGRGKKKRGGDAADPHRTPAFRKTWTLPPREKKKKEKKKRREKNDRLARSIVRSHYD